jgi:hypothetical protein
MHAHRFAPFAVALALALATGSAARSAEILPDDIVFHDTNLVLDVSAPRLALSGKQFIVDVEVSETTGNGWEYTQVELDAGGSTLKSNFVAVPAGGSSTVTFPVTLNDDGGYTIAARLPESAISAQAPVEVTQFRADVANVLLPSLVGYGSQFNHGLFHELWNPNVPPGAPGLQEKINTLEPQLVRVFFPIQAFTTQPEVIPSFVETVERVQETGAVINVTWQSGSTNIELNMSRFAAVLEDLIENRGITNLRWVTLLNEPNSTTVPLPTYEQMYRVLDRHLVTRGIRNQVRFMGGDLVRDRQREYFQYMAANMNDILDAYSVHIYWDYWDPGFFKSRLEDVRKIDQEELPAAARKPIYITEYGVRGIRNVPGQPTLPRPGLWSDGTPMAQTNISAFHVGWFNISSARLGYPGTVIWDLLPGKYNPSYIEDWSLLGPAPDFQPRPGYFLLRLFTATTEPGWRIVGVDGSSGSKLLTAYDGAGGTTVIGLDSSGHTLNDGSGGPSAYTVSGLPALTTFKLVVWNRDGTGQLTSDQEIVTDALGVARLTVAQHAVWALTTHPIAD